MKPKPCPFCGASPYIVFQIGTPSLVKCNFCRVQVEQSVWNQRPLEADLQATLEASANGQGVWPV